MPRSASRHSRRCARLTGSPSINMCAGGGSARPRRPRISRRDFLRNFSNASCSTNSMGTRAGGGRIPHVALDFAAAEEELGATAIDPAKIASPESLEEFFEKEWVRSLFALAVEDLRTLCEHSERARTFRLFESYDLEGNEKSSCEQLSKEYGISVSDVTNALAWARREFRKIALGRLRELCGSAEEFHREARAAFGWDTK